MSFWKRLWVVFRRWRRGSLRDPRALALPKVRMVPCPVCHKGMGKVVDLTEFQGVRTIICPHCGRTIRLEVYESGWMVSLPHR